MSTIVTRAGKGSALTHNEVDANFTNLNTDKVEKTGTDPVVISVNSASDALRITQTGAGNALVVEDIANPDSTPFVVNTDGRMITGATQAYTNYLDGFGGTARNPNVQFNGTSLSTASSSLTNWANADSPPLLVLAKSKSGTVGTMASTFSVGDVAGAIQFSASDNTNFIPTALIEAQIDGTPGTGDMPGRLVFSTTADGGSIPTERVRVTSDGRLQINGSNSLATTLVSTSNTFPLNNAASAYQYRANCTLGTANTGAVGFGSTYNLPATGAFGSSYQFYADTLATDGATLTNNYGVFVAAQAVGTNIYGVYSNIASTTARWNFYANGTADNAFRGNSRFGGVTAPTVAVDVTGAVLATGNVTGGYNNPAAGTTAMAFGSYNVVRVTPNATATYTTTVPAAGTRLTLIILTSGTTSYTITFGTGFKTTGTLVTGTVSARYFMVSFVSDGTNVLETARTVAIA